MTQAQQADPALERIVWVLAAAVAALIVREAWQLIRDRRERRTRDRLILTALAREVFIVRSTAGAIINDINRERTLLAQKGHWRLKPLLRLPTSIYDIVRERIPRALLEESDGLAQLIGLQMHCDFMNRLADEHQRWKSPSARGQDDQLEVIVQFHTSLGEAVTAVVDRATRMLETLEGVADKVGGLDLTKVDPPAETAPPAT